MTRKHYKAIAEAFAGTRPNGPTTHPIHVQWTYTMHVMADTLNNTNTNFDRQAFYKACPA